MPINTPVNYDYLIEPLRIHLWDIDPASYRYTDAWLRSTLCTSIKGLERWWNFKYVINDTTYYVERNPTWVYLYPEPPTIEQADERPIVLYAAILIKSGTMENTAWSTGSWRDAEIAYSNIEGGRLKESSLQRDQDELESILKPPQKRLGYPSKRSLPGYKNNQYERKGSY